MSFLKKHTEIIFSYIIGFVSLFTGLIVLINLPLIKELNQKEKVDLKIFSVWDFLNAFLVKLLE